MRCIKLTLLAILLMHTLVLKAQQAKAVNQANELSEAVLVRENQQQRIDSLLRLKLQGELNTAIGDVKRTKDLEKQLAQITTADSLRKIKQQQQVKQLKRTAKGYPVVLNQDTLFYIYTRIASFTAAERASAVTAKVIKLYKDAFFSPDSLKISHNEGAFDINYKQDIIITVSGLDGLFFDTTNAALAQQYKNTIIKEVLAERKAHSLFNLLKRVAIVLTIIVAITLVVLLINKLFRRIGTIIRANRSKYLNAFRLKSVKVLTSAHLENALLRLATIARILLIVIIIYLSLPLLFSLFPETENWTDTLLEWILTPLRSAAKAIVDYLPNLFKVVVIAFIFHYLIKVIKYIFREIKRSNIQFRGFPPEWALPTFNILRFILYAFMLILIFPFLPGSSSPAFQGVSVFLGVLISLGSSSAISNIVAGLVITYMRPFRVGDRVKIGEVTGDIVEKSMLVTRVRTIKNEDITVPNAMVLSKSTINYSSYTKNDRQGLIIHYTVTVGYSVPWQKVYNLLTQAAQQTIHIEKTPEPFVLQTNLDNFYISYQINAYTLQANAQAHIYSNLLEHIQDIFGKAGVEILSPSYHVVRNGGNEA